MRKISMLFASVLVSLGLFFVSSNAKADEKEMPGFTTMSTTIAAEQTMPEVPAMEKMHPLEKISDTMKVKGNLFVRNAPSIKGKALGILKKGRSVQILGEKDGWYQIVFKEKSGWASGKYLIE